MPAKRRVPSSSLAFRPMITRLIVAGHRARQLPDERRAFLPAAEPRPIRVAGLLIRRTEPRVVQLAAEPAEFGFPRPADRWNERPAFQDSGRCKQTRYRSPMPSDLDRFPLPAAVLFDLDGTLVDPVETRIAAWLKAREEAGLPTSREQLAPLIGLDGKRLAKEVAAVDGVPIDEARAEEIDQLSGEIYERLNRSPRPLPGVRRLVDAIEARDIRWAIATSSRKAQVATSIAALGLAAEPMIVDAGHVKHAKPEPDLLLLAARELGVESARCWSGRASTWAIVSAVAARLVAIGRTAGSAVGGVALAGAGAAAVVASLALVADEIRRR